jgi:hypothetical protein
VFGGINNNNRRQWIELVFVQVLFLFFWFRFSTRYLEGGPAMCGSSSGSARQQWRRQH